jgi:Mg2+-importing ATPase
LDLSTYKKLDEVPYDFIRKRLSILISQGDTHLMVTKGALSNVLAVCSSAEIAEGKIANIATVKERVQQHFEEFSRKGFRTLGVAYKDVVSDTVITREQEAGMTFLGFLILFDPPKQPQKPKQLKNQKQH